MQWMKDDMPAPWLLWVYIVAGLLAAVLLSGCSAPNDDEPLTPLPEYRQWWSTVEACSGHRGSYDDVRWYVLQPGDMRLEEGLRLGHYEGGRVWLAPSIADNALLVEHEMLHALGEHGHSGHAWRKCGIPTHA